MGRSYERFKKKKKGKKKSSTIVEIDFLNVARAHLILLTMNLK